MRRFKFRLERLLNYRNSLTERERIRLARRIGALTRAEDHVVNLRGVRNATKIARLRALEFGMTAREAANLHEHMLRIDDAIVHADGDVGKAKVEVDKTRTELVNRRRDERAIELYRERRWKAWLKDYYRDESRVLDDIGIIRHTRMAKTGD